MKSGKMMSGSSAKTSIYKIIDRATWEQAKTAGQFSGSAIDLDDGFIHFSTGRQVEETASRHFAGQTDLLLVEFDASKFGDALKWELSRGGERFPHLYGALDPADAVSEQDILLNTNGTFKFSQLKIE